MIRSIKAILFYMICGFLVYVFVALFPDFLDSTFHGKNEENYSPTVLSLVDGTIKTFRFLADPLQKFADQEVQKKGKDIIASCLIYMIAAVIVGMYFSRSSFRVRKKGKKEGRYL